MNAGDLSVWKRRRKNKTKYRGHKWIYLLWMECIIFISHWPVYTLVEKIKCHRKTRDYWLRFIMLFFWNVILLLNFFLFHSKHQNRVMLQVCNFSIKIPSWMILTILVQPSFIFQKYFQSSTIIYPNHLL